MCCLRHRRGNDLGNVILQSYITSLGSTTSCEVLLVLFFLSICVCVHVCAGACGSLKSPEVPLDPLELELQAVMNCLM